MTTVPALACRYDQGYFDKDEQGWVANWVEVRSHTDGTVTIRKWGDSAGRNPWEQTIHTRVDGVFPDLALVKFAAAPWYYNYTKHRLIDGGEYVILVTQHAFAEGWLASSRVQSAIGFLCTLVARLGGPHLETPRFESWPERTSTDPYHFDVVTLCDDGVTRFFAETRPAVSADAHPELAIWLTTGWFAASLRVTDQGRAAVAVRGGLEFHRAVAPVVREFLAGWR